MDFWKVLHREILFGSLHDWYLLGFHSWRFSWCFFLGSYFSLLNYVELVIYNITIIEDYNNL